MANQISNDNSIELVRESGNEFTPLNRLASYICGTPVSLVNLLDHNFQYTVSKVGDWNGQTVPKEETVCQFTVENDEILVINDTLKDQRTKSIREIADNDSLRFYAGVPIRSPNGTKIGSFCVIGESPQDLSEKQRRALIDLGKEVEVRIKLLKQKRAAESRNNKLQEAAAFLENSTDLRWVLDPDTFRIVKSEGVRSILGCDNSDVIGKNLFDIIDQINIQNHIKQWTSKQNDHSKLGIPVKVNVASDNEIWLNLTFTKYNGTLLATGRDITKKHQAEEKLKHSLEEKEILLSEVHHRVKNNLAVVSGLLQLEQFQTENQDIINVLRNSESRIKSIAKIHELLYQTDDFVNVQIEPYLHKLISHLIESYSLDKRNIDIDVKVSKLSVNVNQALPIGLIINELVANAIKHAFPNKSKGEITILAIEKEDDTVHIEVSDNGQGLDLEPSEMENEGNLGFTLVNTLIKQLNANLEIRSNNGTTFHFTFQKDDKKGSVSAFRN